MKDDFFGNAFAAHEKVAYIVGDSYAMLSRLPRVMTMKQFTIAILAQNLPLHRVWIVGQGISQDDLQFLRLCETYLQGVRFHFGSQYSLVSQEKCCAESPIESYRVEAINTKLIEWKNFKFIDATRVQAEMHMTQASEDDFLVQDFLFTAAKEITERACQSAVPKGVLLIKQGSFQSFHRLLPLTIMVEAKFQLVQDNKRSLKSVIRFYQAYACTAEMSLLFDLYEKEDADKFYQEVAEKTLEQFTKKMESDC